MRTILVMLALAVGATDLANACSCMRESDDRRIALSEKLARADFVFLGRIEGTRVLKVKEDDFEIEHQQTQFYILQSWKGEKSNRVYVRTALTCCLCEYEFPESGEFLVFAYGPDTSGYYTTSSCDYPKESREATEDIQILNDLNLSGRTNRSSRSREERAPAER
jgi:hypothetical protein